MRTSKESSATIPDVELVPENYFQPLNFTSVFQRIAPIEIDLGCGDGLFLATLAAQRPERNFLGVERLFGRVRSACRKIEQQKLRNARVLRLEITYAVSHILRPKSVDVFHLLFPDPWPKRRHQRRRIVTAEFLDSIHRALSINGKLRIATDQFDYFEGIRRLAMENQKFVVAPVESDSLGPVSAFEKQFTQRSRSIHRLTLRKISD
jgi:tRNA (guanine-N7-)-methyltransferase